MPPGIRKLYGWAWRMTVYMFWLLPFLLFLTGVLTIITSVVAVLAEPGLIVTFFFEYLRGLPDYGRFFMRSIVEQLRIEVLKTVGR